MGDAYMTPHRLGLCEVCRWPIKPGEWVVTTNRDGFVTSTHAPDPTTGHCPDNPAKKEIA